MDKPLKPTDLLPSSFGGQKEAFSDDKIANGYEPDVPDILGGANLNYFLDAAGQNFEYNNAISDFINELPIGSVITVDENNKLVYKNLQSEIQSKGSGFVLFDTKLSDHILTDDETYGWALQGTYVNKNTDLTSGTAAYPDFYAKCVEEKIEATEEIITIGNYSFTGYRHSNGHIYYDIADKTTVDNIYTSTGAAWYYGVDTTNERIFLPRNDWFEQLTGNSSNVNTFTDAGLPDHSHTYKMKSTTGGSNAGGDALNIGLTTFDTGLASDSNSIYGDSDTVQPKSVKKLLYICVGNTIIIKEALTYTSELDAELNNPFFLGMSQYFDKTPNNLSWLKSTGGYYTKAAYTPMYNWILENYNNGVDGFKLSTADDITDYDFVINTEDNTFRLPLLNGERVLVEKKEATYDDSSWYNLYSDGWVEQGDSCGDAYIVYTHKTFTFTKPFIDINYCFVLQSASSENIYSPAISNKTTYSVTIINTCNKDGYGNWTAKGYIDTSYITSTKFNLYYYVGETVQNANLINAAKIEANKADINLSNTEPTQGFKDNVISWNMPDYSAGISLGRLPFTAPFDCYVNFSNTVSDESVFVNGEIVGRFGIYNQGNSFSVYLSKNEVLSSTYNGLSTDSRCSNQYFPLKGVNKNA